MAYAFHEAFLITCCFLVLQTCIVCQTAVHFECSITAGTFNRKHAITIAPKPASVHDVHTKQPLSSLSNSDCVLLDRLLATARSERVTYKPSSVESVLRELSCEVRKIDPDSLYLCALDDELGCILMRTKRYDEAERIFQEALIMVQEKISCPRDWRELPDRGATEFRPLETAAFLERDYGVLLLLTGRTARGNEMIGKADATDHLSISLRFPAKQSDY